MTDLPPLLLDRPILVVFGLFFSILLCIWLGQKLGHRLLETRGEEAGAGVGLIEGGVFALLGLLVALTFSQAVSRFDQRRGMVVDEVNAVGTAELRIDLLPADLQPQMRDAFARYKQSRIDAYANSARFSEFKVGLAKSAVIQREIWALAIEGGRRPDGLPAINMQLLPALNQMFDITTTRAMALVTHTPVVVYLVMWVSALVASFLAGNAMGKGRNISWVHAISFAVVMTLALYVMIDIEYPRIGIVNLDSFVGTLKAITG